LVNTRGHIVGIDKVIEPVKQDMYDFLKTTWAGDIQGYGRVYRNENDGESPVPEWFNSEKGEYEPVYYNDKFAANFFFIDDQTHETTDEFMFDAKIKVVVMADLKRIYPQYEERVDEEAMNTVLKHLRANSYGRYKVTGVVKTVDAVFLGFDRSNIKFNNFGKYITFAIKLTLWYDTDNC